MLRELQYIGAAIYMYLNGARCRTLRNELIYEGNDNYQHRIRHIHFEGIQGSD